MKLFSSKDKIFFEPTANDAPVAVDDSVGTNAGDVIYVAVGASESKGADGTTWDFTIVRGGSPANGELSVNADQTITCTPDPDFHGISELMLVPFVVPALAGI